MHAATAPSFSPGSSASRPTRDSSATVAGSMRGLMPAYLAEMAELAAWRFCPRCSAELGGGDARKECSRCGFVAYASSKPTASAGIVGGGGRGLLGRPEHEPGPRHWALPGG